MTAATMPPAFLPADLCRAVVAMCPKVDWLGFDIYWTTYYAGHDVLVRRRDLPRCTMADFKEMYTPALTAEQALWLLREAGHIIYWTVRGGTAPCCLAYRDRKPTIEVDANGEYITTAADLVAAVVASLQGVGQ